MKLDKSLISLVVVNLITIISALVNEWDFGNLVIVYWFQSIIIGFFTFLKLLSLKDFSTKGFNVNKKIVKATEDIKTFVAFFFLVHYGMFHLVYLVFIGLFTSTNIVNVMPFGFSPFRVFNYLSPDSWLIILLFLINHAYSYITNLRDGQFKGKKIGKVMFEPYKRVFPMHFTIMFGFFFNGTLILLITKTIVDVLSHQAKHKTQSKLIN